MIFPHPESDLSLNIMVLGADVIRALTRKESVLAESLLGDFIKEDKKRTPDMFVNTVLFLYSLDVLTVKGFRIGLKKVMPKQLSLI